MAGLSIFKVPARSIFFFEKKSQKAFSRLLTAPKSTSATDA
jgi:hypothetical protein